MQKQIVIDLQTFDMNKACQRYPKGHPKDLFNEGGINVVFIGMRNSGKTVLIFDFLYHLALQTNIPICTCISPTDKYNKKYSSVIPSKFIHSDYSAELIDSFLQRQKKIKSQVQNDFNLLQNIDTRALLVFDDLFYDVDKWRNDKNILYMLMNGRHLDINFVLSQQDPLGGIPPKMRTQFNYTFICKESRTNNKKKLHDHWCGIVPSYNLFDKILKQATQDYGCLVVDNLSTSENIQEVLYKYKATFPTPNFKLCCQEFWIDNDLYDDNDGDEDNECDLNSYNKNTIIKFK